MFAGQLLRRACRSAFTHVFLTLCIITALSSEPLRAAPSAQDRPTLEVSVLQRASVGEQIELKLAVRGATDLAGYEADLQWAEDAVEFDGLQQRQNDLAAMGRSVEPLGPAARPDGVTVGLVTCPRAACIDAEAGARQDRGGQGRVSLATVTLVGRTAGLVEIRVRGVRFVNTQGASIGVEAAEQALWVQVGDANGGERRGVTVDEPPWRGSEARRRGASGAASTPVATPDQGAAAAAPGVAGAHHALDRTRDQSVSQADLMEMALAWTHVHEAGEPCGPGIAAAHDINGDGCLDVADVQLVASAVGSAAPSPGGPGGPERRQAAPETEGMSPRAEDGEATVARLPLAPAADLTLAAPGEAPLTFVVNSTSDAGDQVPGDGVCRTAGGVCTLRAALDEANRNPGPDTVRFAIPGEGVHTIQPSTQLPIISDATGGTTIDGYSQPGSALNTDPRVSNAVLRIAIVGPGPTTRVDGLVMTSAGNVIRGLSIRNFYVNVRLFGSGARDNVVAGNFVGTDPSGTQGLSAAVINADGIGVAQGAMRNRIGGTHPADRNVVSGNGHAGIGFYTEGTEQNRVQGNIVGLNPAGTARLRNWKHGVDINSIASYNVVGGAAPGEGNVLSGNGETGAEISHSTLTVENQVIGNYIGTDPSGNAGPAYAANAGWGVRIEDGVTNNIVEGNVIGNNTLGGLLTDGYNAWGNQIRNNRIGIGADGAPVPNREYGIQVGFQGGRSTIGPGNIITNNPEGIQVVNPENDGVTITRNSIYANVNAAGCGRGIDLGPLDPCNPNGNDPGDGDSGANEQLNAPVLTSVTPSVATGTACGAAVVPKPCTIEVFIADRGPNASGQGRTFVGAGTTDGSGAFTVQVSGVSVGNVVTATATDAKGNTSEFSQNRSVTSGPVVTITPTPTPVGQTPYAQDSFSRQITNGWGPADVGGTYALEQPGDFRPSTDFDVDNVGTITATAVDQWHSAYLTDVSVRDVDVTVRVRSNRRASGGFLFAYLSARRSGSGLGIAYLGRLTMNPAGELSVQTARIADGTITLLGSEAGTGASYSPGSWTRVRLQVQGANPTTLRIKAWADGQPEPAGWQHTATDSEPDLQGPGAIGVRTLVTSGSTTLPVTFSFDDLLATDIGSAPPVTPTPTHTPTPTSTPAPSSYRETVLADNPIAYWRLGEASGTTAADERGQRPGSYVGSPSLGQSGALPGDTNTAVRFNGNGQYVNVPDAGALSPSAGSNGRISLEAWVRLAGLPSGGPGTVISKGSGSGYEYALRIHSNGAVEMTLWSPGGTTYQYVGTAGGTVTVGNWYHLVGTCQNGSSCRLYVNGAQRSERTSGWGATTPGNTSAPLAIGRRSDNVQYLNGTVDEVAIYGTILSAARVQAHYGAGPSGGSPAAPTSTSVSVSGCEPRPRIDVTTAQGAPGELHVTIRATTDAGTPQNQLVRLAFGPAINAAIQIGAQQGTGNFSVDLPPGTQEARFTVRRTTGGQATTVPMTVTDGCGPWDTFVGGGPSAF